MNKLMIAFCASALVLSACGGGGEKKEKEEKLQLQTQDSQKQAEESAKEEAPAEEEKAPAELTIEGNDQMKFNKNKLTVYEGQKVTLTLKHVGKMPVESMGHNWVLLTKGTEVSTFGTAAVNAGIEADHIPSEKEDQIIAHTELIGGGEETSVTFEAPKPGTYTFICSFPGHYSLMRGKFVVKEA